MLGNDGLGGSGICAGVIDVVSMYEDHDVGVLFERAGFTKICQDGPLLIAQFKVTRELAEGEHRDVQLACQKLEPTTDLGDVSDLVRAPLTAS